MLDILITLHILVLVVAFAFTAGIGILSARISRSGDAKLIHAVYSTARPLQWVGGTCWFLAGALGAWIAVEAAIPFDTPWLLWSYAAFAVLIVAGMGLHAPWQAQVIRAAAAAPDGGITDELAAILRSPINPLASALSAVSFVALVYLMIARPG